MSKTSHTPSKKNLHDLIALGVELVLGVEGAPFETA